MRLLLRPQNTACHLRQTANDQRRPQTDGASAYGGSHRVCNVIRAICTGQDNRKTNSDERVDLTAVDHRDFLGELADHRHFVGDQHDRDAELAVDVGSGDGIMLSSLSPLFEHVLAVEKSPAQLARCQKRIEEECLNNVQTFGGRFEATEIIEYVDRKNGADLVTAVSVMRHTASPQAAVKQLARLLAGGGTLLCADYLPHNDIALQERRGDVWLGFEPDAIQSWMEEAGLVVTNQFQLSSGYFTQRHDSHLPMHVLTAVKP